MRTVFLDIDGVVATDSSYRNAPCIRVPQAWGPAETVWTDPPGLLVPGLVRNVQVLCETAGASVVISSSWRTMHPISDITLWLQSAGLTAPIIGQTPRLFGVPANQPNARGLEIQQWVEANHLEPGDILVLEDKEDVRPYRARQVKTTSHGHRQGFTERHLRVALRLWGLGSNPSGPA